MFKIRTEIMKKHMDLEKAGRWTKQVGDYTLVTLAVTHKGDMVLVCLKKKVGNKDVHVLPTGQLLLDLGFAVEDVNVMLSDIQLFIIERLQDGLNGLKMEWLQAVLLNENGDIPVHLAALREWGLVDSDINQTITQSVAYAEENLKYLLRAYLEPSYESWLAMTRGLSHGDLLKVVNSYVERKPVDAELRNVFSLFTYYVERGVLEFEDLLDLVTFKKLESDMVSVYATRYEKRLKGL